MSFLKEHSKKFEELSSELRPEALSRLRSSSNGGNTVLFTYPPEEESQYLEEGKKRFPTARFIDISKLFVEFIDHIGWEDFRQLYLDYSGSTDQVFRSRNEETPNDLFHRITNAIQESYTDQQIPFLIRTGILEGTGIDNVNIMEHPVVLRGTIPLVIFYPAKMVNDSLMFLNASPSSRYRCRIII